MTIPTWLSVTISFLQGKKTYIVAIGAIISSTGGYLSGSIQLDEYLKNLFSALLAMTLRAGISKRHHDDD